MNDITNTRHAQPSHSKLNAELFDEPLNQLQAQRPDASFDMGADTGFDTSPDMGLGTNFGTGLPYRRQKVSRTKPILLAVAIHLAILGIGYAAFFYKPAPAPSVTTDASTASDAPLSTLSQSEVDREFGDAQGGEQDTANDANAKLAQAANASPAIFASVASNGAVPQPMGVPIIPDNQKLPSELATGRANVGQVQSGAPTEQASADPSINQTINAQTSDGKALIAAVDEADRENDELRRYLEQAKQLNQQKIERDRNLPSLKPTADRVVQQDAADSLTADDVPIAGQ